MTVVLVLAAVVPMACGDNRSAAERAMDAKFRSIDYKMATLETTAVVYNQAYLEKTTQQYIALVREYADLLGRDEAGRRLVEKGNELEPFCPPCTAMVEDAAKRY